MKNNHLIIFVKNKIPGKTKTRLAAGIGPQKAMEIYDLLLAHTHLATRCLPFKKTVYFSQQLENNGLWADGNFSLALQQGPGLGERMQEAFEQQFAAGAERVCIIGSDTFEISPELIQQAFQVLETKDTVIGPAHDGGYYLLGMNELQPEFFQNKAWSTESVLPQTLEDIERLQLSCSLLPQLNDIDHKEDWLAHQKKIKQSSNENI
jgi:rSAM/selenodomain-associated transferase 1